MSSKSPISRFERLARDIVEGSIDRLLRQQGLLTDMVGELALAAESSRRRGMTANHYSVRVHPNTLASLEAQTADVSTILEQMLIRLGERNGLVFAGEVRVEIAPDPSVEERATEIAAEHGKLDDEPTAVLQSQRGGTAPLKMAEAFVIVDGRRHVLLEKPVITVGRSLDNDIVLEDPGVSRSHAQIRWRNGRFEIFDLGSRAGILVNERNVSRAELKSGDVITMGAAALIFGEEDRAEASGAGKAGALAEITQEISADNLP